MYTGIQCYYILDVWPSAVLIRKILVDPGSHHFHLTVFGI